MMLLIISVSSTLNYFSQEQQEILKYHYSQQKTDENTVEMSEVIPTPNDA